MSWTYDDAMDAIQTVDDARRDARAWLMDCAAPLWSGAGVSGNGMFAERIGIDGREVILNRRLRVQARQIYSFCTLSALGWTGPWREIVGRNVDVLIGKGRKDNGLFVHLFDPEGAVISTAYDLYDHAFGLFALAHAGRQLDRPELFDIAETIQQRLDAEFWREEGGYWEGELTPCPPYRQNPHMHMFETAVAHYAATGRDVWKERYQKIAALFVGKFFDPRSGAVTEYFDKNWNRLEDASGQTVEPGHCLEWAWLFEVAPDVAQGVEVSDRLTGFARTHGLNMNTGVAMNEVTTSGEVLDAGARLWPQTERLKAAIARWQRLGSEAEAAEIVAAYKGLRLYFNTPVAGNWWDRRNADGTFVQEAAPASSFYHIVCALNELLSLK